MASPQWVAIDSSTDRRKWARKLARAHERGLAGATAQPEVREVIDQSWRRSARAHVDPISGVAPLVMSEEEATAAWEGSPLRVAEPILRELLADVGAAGQQVVLVCDADGTMLWIDGEQGVLEEATAIHLERGSGWSEDRAGTNAMGTALAAGHSLQVFSAEHFAVPVHEWTCSAAPVRDPETGETLGVLDLSGELATAHPHSLALVEAAARMIEAELATAAAERAMALRERYGDRLWGGGRDGGQPAAGGGAAGRGGPVALSSPGGRIVESAAPELRGRRLAIPREGGEVGRELGLSLVAERLGADGDADGGYLIWRAGRTLPAGAAALEVSMLGRDGALVRAGGRSVALSPRHSEILCLLTLAPAGIGAERLALQLYGEFGKPVTARAELSRLRRALPGAIAANPYRPAVELRDDRSEVEALLAAGRIGEALDRYPGPLLPGSEVPLVEEARRRLDDGLREAILASGSTELLEGWLRNPSGEDDVEACRALVARLGGSDPRRPAAISRLRRLLSPSG
ncbi:MAG: GAF domain-containing protein [Solirubrobacterales bacterium]